MFSTEPAVWRLTKEKYAPDLDGLGARKVGGRWNPPGMAMVYCASSLSLAVLESFVHLPPHLRSKDKFPPMVAVRVILPKDAEILPCPMEDPFAADHRETRASGADWLRSGASLAMVVPSFVVAPERHLLLNPTHPQMSQVTYELSPFRYDARLGNS